MTSKVLPSLSSSSVVIAGDHTNQSSVAMISTSDIIATVPIDQMSANAEIGVSAPSTNTNSTNMVDMLPRVPSHIMVDEATTKLAANQDQEGHVQVHGHDDNGQMITIHHDITTPKKSEDSSNSTMVMPLSLMDIKRNNAPLRTASSGRGEKKHSANQMSVAIDHGATISPNHDTTHGGHGGNDDNDMVQDRDRMFPITREGVSQLMMTSSNRDYRWSMGRLSSSINGLSAPEAAERLFKLGPNALVNLKLDKWYHHLGRAFAHPFNMLLLVLAAIGGATGDFKSLVVLTIMVVVSVITRFSQELKSSIAANDLRKRVTQLVHVRRPVIITPDSIAVDITHMKPTPTTAGAAYEVIQVPFESIVPGDVVELAAGSMIPGDVRILQSDNALVSQSVLTGESIPVEKIAAAHSAKVVSQTNDTPSTGAGAVAVEDSKGDYLRRNNLSFMGSNVSAGSMICLVMVTGNRTYFGANAAQLVHARPPSAFAIGVRKISYLLMMFMIIMMPLIVIINGATTGEWTDAVLFGIAVAVGLTPEMLPMIVNGNLAIGASRMADEKCIIKRLEAIQNIGAMTVLCTDKTGTLTADQVQVHTSIDINGTLSSLPLSVGFAISRHQKGLRNVMDESILHSGSSNASLVTQTAAYIKRGELPFDFVRRCMSVIIEGIVLPTINHDNNGVSSPMLLCKGAFDEIVAKCTHFIAEPLPVDGTTTTAVASQVAPIGDVERKKLTDLSISLPSAGLRIIAVAYRSMGPLSSYGVTDDGAVRITKNDESNLILVGFLTFMDPPKPDAAATLANIASLGVQVKVLSGDNPLVANMVCNQLGLNATAGHTLTGDELFELTADDEDPELRAIFARTVVFSRLNPSQKARVVGVLRDMGHTVGFLGDGINDTLALREADVGISVDTGSDLAKDAADVILTEKNLSVIHSAIVTGRRTHGNTVKYIYMAASSNFGNVFSLLVAAAWLPFIPMRPLHLLAQNLLYDFSQIAIPFDNVDDAYIRTPKQWAIGSLSSFMLCIGPISSIFDVTTFSIAWWYYGYDNVDDAQRFQTCWFLVGIMTQLTIVHAIRSDQPFIGRHGQPGSRASWHVWFASLLLGGIALLLPNVSGAADLLSFTPPPANFYGWMAMILVVYVGLTQIAKHFYIRHFKRWL